MSYQIEVTLLECGECILTPSDAKGVNLPEANIEYEDLPQSVVMALHVLDVAGVGHPVDRIGVKQGDQKYIIYESCLSLYKRVILDPV